MVERLVWAAVGVTTRQARGNGGRDRLEGEGSTPEVNKTEICVRVVLYKGM